jgi:hypothetical protein
MLSYGCREKAYAGGHQTMVRRKRAIIRVFKRQKLERQPCLRILTEN